ncbi:hypothetical protein [Paenibacillus validus]|uniref:hypothetical protein n=1 Tax=Paenibacillus validus TaxID=44253 RepID=UPI003D280DFF
MGVKFGREYKDIITDFADALQSASGCHDFLEMSAEDWGELEAEEREACMKTLADDLFYGLGTEGSMHVGNCVVTHDAKRHIIRVATGDSFTRIIHLV